MQKIRLGIIGIGNMGTTHCKNIQEGKLVDFHLCAVADRRESRREWARQNLSAETIIFEEGKDLIASRICDAVLIAVPHYQHPELSILALENHLHVMCEKPAGVYTKQVREMNEAAEKSDCIFGMMFNQRTNSIYRKMKEIVSGGDMGEIKRVTWIVTDWYRTQSYYDSGSWRATWDGEGGEMCIRDRYQTPNAA